MLRIARKYEDGGVLSCSPRKNQKRQRCRRKSCKLRRGALSQSTVPGRPAFHAGLRCAKRTVEKRKKSLGENKFSPRLSIRFSFTQELTWRHRPTSRKLFGISPSLHRGLGSRGRLSPGAELEAAEASNVSLWRMKRGVVLNRNEHATGREQATIEVADRGRPPSFPSILYEPRAYSPCSAAKAAACALARRSATMGSSTKGFTPCTASTG